MIKQRYSKLAPIPQEQLSSIAVDMCNFFHPLNNRHFRKALELPIDKTAIPLSLLDFFRYKKKCGCDLMPEMQRLANLALKLEHAGILKRVFGFSYNNPSYFFFMN
jgi:hypothetical protein